MKTFLTDTALGITLYSSLTFVTVMTLLFFFGVADPYRLDSYEPWVDTWAKFDTIALIVFSVRYDRERITAYHKRCKAEARQLQIRQRLAEQKEREAAARRKLLSDYPEGLQ